MLNMEFMGRADRRATLNRMCRAQLEEVRSHLNYYLEKEQMPHEWGSIDSWTYMTGALGIATKLMEALMQEADPAAEFDVDTDEGVKKLIRSFRDDYFSGDSFAEALWEFAGLSEYEPVDRN